MVTNNEKMNFSDYYKSFTELTGTLKKRVCEKLQISEKTFYNRVKNNSWSLLEQEAVDTIVKEIQDELSKMQH